MTCINLIFVLVSNYSKRTVTEQTNNTYTVTLDGRSVSCKMPCYAVLDNVMLLIPCYTVLYYVMLCYVLLGYAVVCYLIVYVVIMLLSGVILSYVVLCFHPL